MRSKIIIVLAILLSLSSIAHAQTDAAAESEPAEREFVVRSRNWEVAESYRLDLTVPEAPAFALLGLDSPEVATPRDAPALTTELANLFDSGGTLKAGIALTVQPYWLGNQGLTLDEYAGEPDPTPNVRREGRSYRRVSYTERALLARTRVSLASAEVPDVEDAVRLGLGVTFQPLDDQDPRLDRLTAAERLNGDRAIDQCLNEATTSLERDIRAAVDAEMIAWVRQHPNASEADYVLARQRRIRELRDEPASDREARAAAILAGEEVSGLDPASVTRFETNAQACVDQWRHRQARRPNLIFAIGQTYISESGAADDLDSEGFTAWVGYSRSLPLENMFTSFADGRYNSRVNFYARYADAETVAIDEESSGEAQVGVAAVSINLANIAEGERNWQFGLEAAYRTEQFGDGATPDREFTQVALNASMRVNDGLWLRAAYGTRGDEEDEFFRLSFVIAERAEN